MEIREYKVSHWARCDIRHWTRNDEDNTKTNRDKTGQGQNTVSLISESKNIEW